MLYKSAQLKGSQRMKRCVDSYALTNQHHALFSRALNTTTPKPSKASKQHHISQRKILVGFFFWCFALFFYLINYLNLIMNLSEETIKASDMSIIA
jgi:hypothetical protein